MIFEAEASTRICTVTNEGEADVIMLLSRECFCQQSVLRLNFTIAITFNNRCFFLTEIFYNISYILCCKAYSYWDYSHKNSS